MRSARRQPSLNRGAHLPDLARKQKPPGHLSLGDAAPARRVNQLSRVLLLQLT